MNIEELEKEADEYAKKDCPDNFLCTRNIARRGYLAGAEPREKRITELEEQIEKMKASSSIQRQQIAKLENQVLKLTAQVEKVKHYLDYDIPLDFVNEATIKIYKMLK